MSCKSIQKIICQEIYKDAPKRIKQMFMIYQDDVSLRQLDKKNELVICKIWWTNSI